MTWLIVDRVGLGFSELGDVAPGAWLPDPLGFAAASLLLLGAYFFSAALWGMLVHDLGGPRLPVATSVHLFMIANLGRYIPGKVWQIAGLATLARGHGVPPATGAGAAVLGQGIALVAASAIGLGAALTAPPPYPTWGVAVGVAIGILVVLVSIPSVFAPLARGWFRLTRTEAPPTLGSVHALRWLALYAVNWVAYALAFWVLASSLGIQAGVVPVASAFAAAYVLGYLMIFAPAGLGPREGFLIAFLTPHVGPAASGVVAVVARLWTTLVELVPAGFFWARYLAASRPADAGASGEGGP